jgi:hypothetical protein
VVAEPAEDRGGRRWTSCIFIVRKDEQRGEGSFYGPPKGAGITYHRTNCVLIEWVIPDAQNAREDRSGGSAIIESRIGTGGRVARSLLVPLFAVGVVSECRRVQGGNTVVYACL